MWTKHVRRSVAHSPTPPPDRYRDGAVAAHLRVGAADAISVVRPGNAGTHAPPRTDLR